MATPSEPAGARTRAGRRAELLELLETAGRASSVATVMFHTAVAARQGLSASEEKALDLLERSGPLTAGELARQSGLAPASVTGLINRLEHKGFARRIQNPSDRRSILVEADGLLLSLYGPAIPQLRQAYGVSGGGSALVLSAHFAGAMTGIAWWGLERRLAAGTWLRAATALLVAGATGIAFAPAWPVVLAAAFALGVGFGVVVVEINVLLADAYRQRAPAMLNLLGATFGAGAVVGPLAIAA